MLHKTYKEKSSVMNKAGIGKYREQVGQYTAAL